MLLQSDGLCGGGGGGSLCGRHRRGRRRCDVGDDAERQRRAHVDSHERHAADRHLRREVVYREQVRVEIGLACECAITLCALERPQAQVHGVDVPLQRLLRRRGEAAELARKVASLLVHESYMSVEISLLRAAEIADCAVIRLELEMYVGDVYAQIRDRRELLLARLADDRADRVTRRRRRHSEQERKRERWYFDKNHKMLSKARRSELQASLAYAEQ